MYIKVNIDGMVIFGSSYFISDEDPQTCLVNSKGEFKSLWCHFTDFWDEGFIPEDKREEEDNLFQHAYLKITCNGKTKIFEGECGLDGDSFYISGKDMIKFLKKNCLGKQVSIEGVIAEKAKEIKEYLIIKEQETLACEFKEIKKKKKLKI